MKRSIKLAVVLILTSVFMMGCNLDDVASCPSPLTGPLSGTENEFVGEWALINMVADEAVDLTNDGVNNPSTQIYAQLSACSQDLVYEFKSDRALLIKQGYVASNCQNQFTLNATWRISGGQLTTVLQCQSQTNEVEINNEFTQFTLAANFQANDVNGVVFTSNVTFTYEKI